VLFENTQNIFFLILAMNKFLFVIVCSAFSLFLSASAAGFFSLAEL
jgi:hypothetical protein